jgi:2-amino-4-hydroxy-6-hydroxymethyldihydropteridine diphosphokinase
VPEVIAYVALGSNLDNPEKQVLTAFATLGKTANIRFIKASKLYHTKPVGYLQQPDFVNAVVKLGVKLSAFALLKVLQSIENQQGRIRGVERNGPRTLDLDLLLYGSRRIVSKELVVPHPRMLERQFVLEPLGEIGGVVPNIPRSQSRAATFSRAMRVS